MDEKKHPNSSESKRDQSTAESENPNMTRPILKRSKTRRWIYPALYLGAAAVIIGVVYAKTQSGGGATAPVVSPSVTDTGNPSPDTTQADTFIWPVNVAHKVTLGFFSADGTAKQQAAALVQYGGSYYAHKGVDIQSDTGTSFDVLAALAGKVTLVENNPLYGWTVEVTSNDGYVEKYESLGNVTVKTGDNVSQGETIGTSGTCRFEENQGNHLYFQVNQDGKLLNPLDLLPKE
ncbi:peptidoglycan DD-metalloendopeptidase family protein [Alicyclobacillus tolerans]|uniref:Stage II sporulation protein Q n=2 Tax=Alicyclobacillus tolerans TaxID=90970 RepID=A0A1M6TDQ6_9BACL|nr:MULTISPECIES: M23 family metallopeptidase [Alicyclobacillus]MDP9727737.1 stage II sporulation protein Q [Alicyclobacillus tengchongensis]QRF24421.1 M23 family metallopeptidase [Alicyclobacillus sp. TC]SHK55110.1 stage II sporulation protein Q [Alicyclobacillus montanus]